MFDRHITSRFLSALNHIVYGAVTVTTPDGKIHAFKGDKEGAEAQLVINDWRVIGAMISRGDIALAEGYRDGWWDSDDPAQLFLFGLQNQAALDTYIYGNVFGGLASRITARPRPRSSTLPKVFMLNAKMQ